MEQEVSFKKWTLWREECGRHFDGAAPHLFNGEKTEASEASENFPFFQADSLFLILRCIVRSPRLTASNLTQRHEIPENWQRPCKTPVSVRKIIGGIVMRQV